MNSPATTNIEGQHSSRTLSIVVPCFNEEESIPVFYSETQKITAQMRSAKKIARIEYVFVDDGSSDATLSVLRRLSARDAHVHYVSFSRNFGKEAALYAGLAQARGDFIAVMDADLQDPPSLLPEMLNALLPTKRSNATTSTTEAETAEAQPAFECAAARRTTRKGEPKLRSFFARLFYKIIGSLSDREVVDGARDFRVMTRRYRDAVLSLSERNRFSKGIFPWVGFKTRWFEFENRERTAGESKWSFWKLFLYALDGITAFSTKPLMLASIVGIFEFFAAIFLTIFIVVRKIAFGDPVAGWASTACILLFTTGLNAFALGILGQYTARIYTESKRRPLFIVKETENDIARGKQYGGE